MEKPNKSRSLFLKFLPKAASAVSFQNPPFSPGRDHHHPHHSSTKLKAHAYKGFSGPINFSALPDEARSKPKNGGSFHAQEPTSPKVSCMGQIKHKHKKKKLSKAAKSDKSSPFIEEPKKSNSAIGRLRFFSRSSPKDQATRRRKSNGSQNSDHDEKGRSAALDHEKVPSLGQMRKFASGRESLANFDWTAQIAPIDHDRDCYSDEERRRSDSDDEDEEREVIIPYSAPILMVGGRRGELGLEPRKEVNLWKRRTMAPPHPLSLNSKA